MSALHAPVFPAIFPAVLVANRGEIATRIVRTLDRLGVRSIAVHADADRSSPHVAAASTSVSLGPGPPRDTYLRGDLIIAAALDTGAAAIHPGYGFLSENAEFAEAVEHAGLVFIGPTPDQIRLFGSKHTARDAARSAGLPLLAGSGLLDDADHAVAEAERIGFPVMLKSTGGGGGIGMMACADADAVRSGFESVQRLAAASFATPGVFVERLVSRARHLEVQIFGDGCGRVTTLGVRDCSLQRRHQKIVEESPPFGIADDLGHQLSDAATRLGACVSYRSAGTVEFVYDIDRDEASFLEVNTRLQVEHPVTEAIWGVDLVEWMVRQAGGDPGVLDRRPSQPEGHAIEVRVCAEDPARGYRPSAGLLTDVRFPAGVRCDSWVRTGTEVSAFYDSLLAKLVVHAPDRPTALDRMRRALDDTRLAGIETNVAFVRDLLDDPDVASGTLTTGTLDAFADARRPSPTIEVLRAGSMTTVQDHPGRVGYWSVGVPPSGPMDDRSLRLANRAVGNPEGLPALELTLDGPALRFETATTICLGGSPMPATLDGRPVEPWTPIEVAPGEVLDIGASPGPGLRAYLAVAGGIEVPTYLGSASTFTLGGFGGHGGRALRPGDVLHLGAGATARPAGGTCPPASIPEAERPVLTSTWRIGVMEGPHAAPEFFTPDDIDALYATDWLIHHNSSRTGVRLVGPKPRWARPDGGDAGLHPSNIHDTAYAFGTIDFTGDMPIILGPDGPSLGGFVCPATVVAGERWKIGQLRPGDTVRFVPVSPGTSSLGSASRGAGVRSGRDEAGGVLARRPGDDSRPAACYRRAGDEFLLVEYGPMVLDLALRMRVHALAEWVAANVSDGVVDLTPGIRSLQIHVDADRLSVERLCAVLQMAEAELPTVGDLAVPSREIHLPLSWDDPATREAIDRYMASVRDDAPWCPWNIEFIRRINGLESVDDVKRIVYDASYLVLGLGDVYLGAPVATPLDPRHRLVTTKYNPARTWTPENAVGIGGAYLCIYGMEGPGGYQFVGRTVPVWNRFRTTEHFEPGSPWLLRFFDRIRWFPVGADELIDMRGELIDGRLELRVDEGIFRLADHQRELADHAAEIDAFQHRQQAAFQTERAAWQAAGEFDERPEAIEAATAAAIELPPGGVLIESPMLASVWRVDVEIGQAVVAGDPLLSLEAMKAEFEIVAPCAGVVDQVLTSVGRQVDGGGPLLVIARGEGP